MFWPERQQLRVFAHLAPVDMRKQRHGLAALAQNVIAQDPCSGALFIFIGKGRDKLKIRVLPVGVRECSSGGEVS